MTKQELFDAFEGKISKSAIRKVDDEYRVVGKFCYVAPQDGGFDLFICNPRDMVAGLGARKVNNLCQAIFEPDKYTLLDGEAFGTVDATAITGNLKLLGIRKKREGGDVSNLRQGQP